jgi:hypothetical protein
MRKVRHKNVVQFIGACTRKPNLCIVFEYMSGGSVYDYIRRVSLALGADRACIESNEHGVWGIERSLCWLQIQAAYRARREGPSPAVTAVNNCFGRLVWRCTHQRMHYRRRSGMGTKGGGIAAQEALPRPGLPMACHSP